MATRTVLITGASDGIGLALARLYLRRGDRVLGVGRRPAEQIDEGLRGDYCRADLAQPYGAAVVADFLAMRGVARLDLLIHCAGVGSYGPVAAQTPAAIEALVATNLAAPIALTHGLLPLLAAARGRVVFVGSVAAALPVADYAVYGAGKAALAGFARSLRVELRGLVGVQVVHPGATRTAMHAKVGAPLARIGWRRFPPPERVARQIAGAIERGAPVSTIGLGNRLLRFAGRHLPGLVERLARWGVQRAEASVDRPSSFILHPSSFHLAITGGADGIGRALAEGYARAGAAVTIVDRDAGRGEALCRELRGQGCNAGFVWADLAEPAALDGTLRRLGELPPIDLLVHCAGISAVGPFAGSELARQRAVLAVNLLAPLQLTAGLLRAGRIAPRGSLVFVASLSVFTGYPGAAVYAASKDGLAAYARSLRVALAGTGGHVLTVYPGPTRTAHARRYSPDNSREARRMAPERVAAMIMAAVARREPALVPGAANRLVAAVGRLFPAATEELMRRTLYEPLRKAEG